ncbi:DUF6174 domain-containing protein [Pelagicoccus mobilis]|uniref:Uncharacterized protein n=1 Tax=Pelagicoccus mobilis TaxID=415221 RepID=A0A934RTQ8_9BACT|nr:DUF6174 domain-containing protein [Pelagicoccus mobilis]MBK1876268.1 hypothetical protein [Pelagicoccus mobilis]
MRPYATLLALACVLAETTSPSSGSERLLIQEIQSTSYSSPSLSFQFTHQADEIKRRRYRIELSLDFKTWYPVGTIQAELAPHEKWPASATWPYYYPIPNFPVFYRLVTVDDAAELEAARALWDQNKPENYQYYDRDYSAWTFDIHGYLHSIRNNEFRTTLSIKDPTAPENTTDHKYSIEDYFELIERTLDARVLNVRYHPKFGYPIEIRIDDRNGLDDLYHDFHLALWESTLVPASSKPTNAYEAPVTIIGASTSSDWLTIEVDYQRDILDGNEFVLEYDPAILESTKPDSVSLTLRLLTLTPPELQRELQDPSILNRKHPIEFSLSEFQAAFTEAHGRTDSIRLMVRTKGSDAPPVLVDYPTP